MLIFKCYFLWRPHCSIQKPFTRVSLSGIHFSAESTEAMRTKCLAQGHNIQMQLLLKPLITASRNRHLTHMTNMLLILQLYIYNNIIIKIPSTKNYSGNRPLHYQSQLMQLNLADSTVEHEVLLELLKACDVPIAHTTESGSLYDIQHFSFLIKQD